MTALVSKKDFAAIYGCSKAYVSQLVAAQRLVLSDDGKLVDVERSLEQLGATADPSKAGVRERWEAYRADHAQPAVTSAAAAPATVAAAEPVQQTLIDDQPAAAGQPPIVRGDYHAARTRREEAQAELAQIELMKERGKVLDTESTLRAVASAHIAVRSELTNLADRLTPLVLGLTDRRRVWELIQAECDRMATTLQKSAQQMAQQGRVEVTA